MVTGLTFPRLQLTRPRRSPRLTLQNGGLCSGGRFSDRRKDDSHTRSFRRDGQVEHSSHFDAPRVTNSLFVSEDYNIARTLLQGLVLPHQKKKAALKPKARASSNCHSCHAKGIYTYCSKRKTKTEIGGKTVKH